MRILLFLLLLISQAHSFGQSNHDALLVINNPDRELYWGYKNKISFAVPGIDNSQLELFASTPDLEEKSARTIKEDDGWIVKVNRTVPSVLLEVKNGPTIVYSERIKARPLPRALLTFAGYSHSSIVSIENILKDPCISMEMRGANVNADFTIENAQIHLYSTKILQNKGLIGSFEFDGTCLTEEAVSALQANDVQGVTVIAQYVGPDNIRRKTGVHLDILDNLKFQLQNERIKVAEKDEELMSREKVLLAQDSILGEQKTILSGQQGELDKNLQELEIQQSQMKEQEAVLDNNLVKINSQQNLLYLFIVIVLFVSILLFIAYRNYRLKKLAMNEVVEQKEVIEEQHQEIKDSMEYAKRIQSAILPPQKLVKEYLKESFILYKPKDIVAGDFYWMEHKAGKVLFAAADCTGHGVPGAMVSVICNGALNRAVREFGLTEPAKILGKARDIVIEEFEKSEEEVKDGMDIALCSLEGNKLIYAGAHNPLWIVRSGEILETKANKQPIGKFDNPLPYTSHSFDLEKGDTIYIFSDGFVDQFGGEKGKKFKAKAFRKLLLSIQDKTLEEQSLIIDQAFESWRGKLEQIDDVCVIGVRV
jgi:serine phosphatase RsbU (regulator of sigma subunit)